MMCDYPGCPKVYHQMCLRMRLPPRDDATFCCPWHTCCACGAFELDTLGEVFPSDLPDPSFTQTRKEYEAKNNATAGRHAQAGNACLIPSVGALVVVLEDMSPGKKIQGGVARVLSRYPDRSTVDLKYVLDSRCLSEVGRGMYTEWSAEDNANGSATPKRSSGRRKASSSSVSSSSSSSSAASSSSSSSSNQAPPKETFVNTTFWRCADAPLAFCAYCALEQEFCAPEPVTMDDASKVSAASATAALAQSSVPPAGGNSGALSSGGNRGKKRTAWLTVPAHQYDRTTGTAEYPESSMPKVIAEGEESSSSSSSVSSSSSASSSTPQHSFVQTSSGIVSRSVTSKEVFARGFTRIRGKWSIEIQTYRPILYCAATFQHGRQGRENKTENQICFRHLHGQDRGQNWRQVCENETQTCFRVFGDVVGTA